MVLIDLKASYNVFLFLKFKKTNLYENDRIFSDFGAHLLPDTEVVSQFNSSW